MLVQKFEPEPIDRIKAGAVAPMDRDPLVPVAPIGGEEVATIAHRADLAAAGFHREDRAGAQRVFRDLRLERVEPGEFLLRPEELDQRHAQMAAV